MPRVKWSCTPSLLLVALSWPTAGLTQSLDPQQGTAQRVPQQGIMQPAGPQQSIMQPFGTAPTGILGTNAGLRQQVEGLFNAPAGKALTEEPSPGEEEEAQKKVMPVWQILPSIGVTGAWTNAAPTGGRNVRDSWIGVLEPALLVNANTDHIQGSLNLAPKLQYFTSTSVQNGFDNNFDGNAHLTLWPEHFYVDLQGFGAVQSALGGVGPSGTTILDRQSANQTYSFSATPYLRERWGDLVTAEVGTTLGYTSQNPLANSTAINSATGNTSQYMNSLREFMVFTLGPSFGRTSGAVTASATQMDGTGVSRNAYRNAVLVNLGYGLARNFTVLATAGYEDIAYHTLPAYRVNEGVWRAGFRWTPDPDSSLTVTYGRQYGITAPRVDASYAATGYLRLFARYSEEVTSQLQDLQEAVNSSILDPFGDPVDPVTGAPLLLVNNFYGSQTNNVLNQTANASISAALLFDRDTITLTGTRRRQKPIGFAPSSSSSFNYTTERDWLGSVSWEHDVDPNLRLNAFLEYGTRTGGSLGLGGGDSTLFVTSVSLTYSLNAVTRLRLQYSYSTEATGLSKTPTNIITFGIRRDL